MDNRLAGVVAALPMLLDVVEGYIHFDLPLDGKWSDVTAVFDIWKFEEKRVLHLEDMHVL